MSVNSVERSNVGIEHIGLEKKQPITPLKKEEDENAVATPRDIIALGEENPKSDKGIYRVEADENGNKKIIFNRPDSVDSSEDPNSEKADGAEDEKPEITTVNTDKVDAEIEGLKQRQSKIEQQINSAKDENERKQLEKELAQTEAELSLKDNDSYRRANAIVT